jgi:hypothetical protein
VRRRRSTPSSATGALNGGDLVGGGDYLLLAASTGATGGTYVYDFAEGRLEQVADERSSWMVGTGPTPGDTFMWTTPVGKELRLFGDKGATVHLGELVG